MLWFNFIVSHFTADISSSPLQARHWHQKFILMPSHFACNKDRRNKNEKIKKMLSLSLLIYNQ